ncbi:hypothetical protein BGZ93_001650 [Podila epicladia]|nr:hypothetical protein BGZ93_001650 [Podila epicladia]KAG0084463.1 hypothetical protein BGZ92_009847 [Podila epicladia]
MTSKVAHPLRSLHLFLAAFGVILIVLNASLISWATPERSVFSDAQSDLFSRISASLLVPNVAMVLMYLTLAIGRVRFSSQVNHSLCRVLFSLAIAVGLLYFHSAYLDMKVQQQKVLEYIAQFRERAPPRSLADNYFCVLGDVSDVPAAVIEHALNGCRTFVSSSVLSFFAAFMVVVELVVASRSGDIGEEKKEQEAGGEGIGEAGRRPIEDSRHEDETKDHAHGCVRSKAQEAVAHGKGQVHEDHAQARGEGGNERAIVDWDGLADDFFEVSKALRAGGYHQRMKAE